MENGYAWHTNTSSTISFSLETHVGSIGFRVQIWMLKADHEHKSNWLDIPGRHAVDNPCPQCDCDTSDTDKSWAAVPPLKSWRSFMTMAEWYHWCDNVVVGGVKGKPPMLWFVTWEEGAWACPSSCCGKIPCMCATSASRIMSSRTRS